MTAPTPPERRRLATVDVELVARRLATLREALADAAATAGRRQAPAVLVASKYFEPEAIPALVQAGATLLGENRADVLAAKQATIEAGAAQWDYIGELQSRKVKDLVGHVARIHTLASESAVRRLLALSETGVPLPELLVQVNVAGEDGKGGIAPDQLPASSMPRRASRSADS